MQRLIFILAVILPFSIASYCGKYGVPYSFEVLSSGAPVLGCAQPSCLIQPEDFEEDSEFLTDAKGQVDGYFREGDRDTKRYRHESAPKFVANCSGGFENLACTNKNQWVGGIEYIDHPRQPLVLQCCSYDSLKFSQEVGMTTIGPGEAITGGEVVRNGRQISFDVIANVKKIVNSGKINYEVTVRRMNCLPDPPEPEIPFDDDVPSEIVKVLGTAKNGKDLGTVEKFEKKNKKPTDKVKKNKKHKKAKTTAAPEPSTQPPTEPSPQPTQPPVQETQPPVQTVVVTEAPKPVTRHLPDPPAQPQQPQAPIQPAPEQPQQPQVPYNTQQVPQQPIQPVQQPAQEVPGPPQPQPIGGAQQQGLQQVPINQAGVQAAQGASEQAGAQGQGQIYPQQGQLPTQQSVPNSQQGPQGNFGCQENAPIQQAVFQQPNQPCYGVANQQYGPTPAPPAAVTPATILLTFPTLPPHSFPPHSFPPHSFPTLPPHTFPPGIPTLPPHSFAPAGDTIAPLTFPPGPLTFPTLPPHTLPPGGGFPTLPPHTFPPGIPTLPPHTFPPGGFPTLPPHTFPPGVPTFSPHTFPPFPSIPGFPAPSGTGPAAAFGVPTAGASGASATGVGASGTGAAALGAPSVAASGSAPLAPIPGLPGASSSGGLDVLASLFGGAPAAGTAGAAGASAAPALPTLPTLAPELFGLPASVTPPPAPQPLPIVETSGVQAQSQSNNNPGAPMNLELPKLDSPPELSVLEQQLRNQGPAQNAAPTFQQSQSIPNECGDATTTTTQSSLDCANNQVVQVPAMTSGVLPTVQELHAQQHPDLLRGPAHSYYFPQAPAQPAQPAQVQQVQQQVPYYTNAAGKK